MVGDRHTEDGIAEELDALVGLEDGVLGTPAPVGEGAVEQGGVSEGVRQPLGEASEGGGIDQVWPTRPKT